MLTRNTERLNIFDYRPQHPEICYWRHHQQDHLKVFCREFCRSEKIAKQYYFSQWNRRILVVYFSVWLMRGILCGWYSEAKQTAFLCERKFMAQGKKLFYYEIRHLSGYFNGKHHIWKCCCWEAETLRLVVYLFSWHEKMTIKWAKCPRRNYGLRDNLINSWWKMFKEYCFASCWRILQFNPSKREVTSAGNYLVLTFISIWV